jgi:ankyrin repeat protein
LLLIERGVKLNLGLSTEPDDTPLMLAAFAEHVAVIGTLMKAGASLSQTDSNGKNVVHQFADSDERGVLATILQYAEEHASERLLDFETKDGDGKTALMIAEEKGRMINAHILRGSLEELARLENA